MEGYPPDLPPLQIQPRDLENASPFLKSHESHVEEGNFYDFGYVHKGIYLKFNLSTQGYLIEVQFVHTRVSN